MKRMGTSLAAKSKSPWTAVATMPRSSQLTRDVDADVCVVGGGIAGLTTAYLLGKEGKRVVVLEDGSLASGMTGVTTAHLSNAIDDRFTEIERWHGERGAQLAAESHGAAIDRIEAIAQELGVDCDFKRLHAYLFCAPGDDPGNLEKELAAAHRAGLSEAEMIPRAPLDYDTGPCIRFPQQARFHPLKYLAALAHAIKASPPQQSRLSRHAAQLRSWRASNLSSTLTDRKTIADTSADRTFSKSHPEKGCTQW